MTNLEFADRLTTDPFTNYNDYVYGSFQYGKIRLCNDSENLPYIIKGGMTGNQKLFNITYSWYSTQFKSRVLNTKKIKDILNSSKYPILITVKDIKYFAGKGFLAIPAGFNNDPYFLFVACVNGKIVKPSLGDVKFFVSRAVYSEEHKPILPIIKELMANHVGDVVITNNMSKYIGETIKLPAGGTIQEQKKYKDAVVKECITDVLKWE